MELGVVNGPKTPFFGGYVFTTFRGEKYFSYVVRDRKDNPSYFWLVDGIESVTKEGAEINHQNLVKKWEKFCRKESV